MLVDGEVTATMLIVSPSNDCRTETHPTAAHVDNLHDVVRAIQTAIHDDVPMLEVAAGESDCGGGVLNHASIVGAPGGQLKQIERAPGGVTFLPPGALSGFVFVSVTLKESVSEA